MHDWDELILSLWHLGFLRPLFNCGRWNSVWDAHITVGTVVFLQFRLEHSSKTCSILAVCDSQLQHSMYMYCTTISVVQLILFRMRVFWMKLGNWVRLKNMSWSPAKNLVSRSSMWMKIMYFGLTVAFPVHFYFPGVSTVVWWLLRWILIQWPMNM